MDCRGCSVENSLIFFKILESHGFKKDLKSSLEDGRRVYYKRATYWVFYHKGDFFIITRYLQEKILDNEHLKSFLYYINSSEKSYLRNFIAEYDCISKDIRIKTYYLKNRMTEQLSKYNNNIKYLPGKNILKIKARDRILKILNEIDNLYLY